MSNTIPLPPLPEPDCQGIYFDGHSPETIRTRDIEVVRVVLEAAALVCEVQSDTGSINQQWMRERCAAAIRALEVGHD